MVSGETSLGLLLYKYVQIVTTLDNAIETK